MVKLKDAKCPSCGANIQVNDKLENTICQYCGNTVLIEEAIEKKQIEISGKVEVDGIKTNATRLEEAKKHFKMKEYNKAINLINELLEKEHFNIEAHCEYLKNKIELYNIHQNDKGVSIAYAEDNAYWDAVRNINSYYKRLLKMDDKNESEKYLGDYINIINYCQEIETKLEKDEKDVMFLNKKTNSIIREYSHLGEAIMIFRDVFFINISEKTVHRDYDYLESSWYVFDSVAFTRRGDAIITYKRDDFNTSNQKYIQEFKKTSEKVTNVEELRNRVDKFVNTLKDNIKYKRQGKLFETNRRNQMSFKDKLDEDVGNIVDFISSSIKLILRLLIPSAVIVSSLISIVAGIKKQGINSEDTLAVIIGSAILGIPCVIWIIHIIKKRNEY